MSVDESGAKVGQGRGRMPMKGHAGAAAVSPTVDFYAGLQKAFDHFNQSLFDGSLPPCLLTLRSAQRTYGYHHRERFINREGQTLDELALHPGFFTLRPVEQVLSTLVHEMVHHWQEVYGQPSKSNHHNRQWGEKMRAVGLEPSSTGLPKGKATGRTVSHYILPDGPFIQACKELVSQGYSLQWFDRHMPRGAAQEEERHRALAEAGIEVAMSDVPAQVIVPQENDMPLLVSPPAKPLIDRVKFVCVPCGTKAWAASATDLLCGRCQAPLVPLE